MAIVIGAGGAMNSTVTLTSLCWRNSSAATTRKVRMAGFCGDEAANKTPLRKPMLANIDCRKP